MFFKLKQKILEKKYKKAQPLYIIGLWAKYGIMEYKYANSFNEQGVPMVIIYDDHNGTFEEYKIIPYYKATTGFIYDYAFSRERAEEKLKKYEKMGKGVF